MATCFNVCRGQMRGADRLLKLCSNSDLQAQTRLPRTTFVTKARAVSKTPQPDTSATKESFTLLQNERLDRADRSVLITCPSNVSEKKFIDFVSNHGEIKNYFFYQTLEMHAVVEFSSRDSISSIKSCSTISSYNEASVPFKTRFLKLRSAGAGGKSNVPKCHELSPVSVKELIKRLSREETVDQQLQCLTETYQLTEENISLRYLVCSLVRDIAAAFFPECIIRPFGSTVNSFGKLGCDLDMLLDLDPVRGLKQRKGPGMALHYQVKTRSTERDVTQSILSVIGECVYHFSSGCATVHKILNARCPLVRFSHHPSGLQCDLTANNRVAMKSSELLFVYGSMDTRVRYLVFTVRCWARVHEITSSVPGAWITNFALTMLVLFFLQQRSPGILPTLNQLRDLADPSDKCVIEGNDCTFVSDLSKITLGQNTDTLVNLMQEFFEFYSNFAFSRSSINIRTGREQNKPESSPLHIQNPFETSLNVSKNVNSTQLDRFVTLCKESAWLLQQQDIRTRGSARSANQIRPWGLAALLMPSVAGLAGLTDSKNISRESASERVKRLLNTLKSEEGAGEK